MKRSQESSSVNFFWRWKQAHVVSSRDTTYLWDKFLRVILKVRGVLSLHFFFWTFFSYGIGTISEKMVSDRHLWKVAKTKSKSFRVQIPSLDTPECSGWIWISRGLWITIHRYEKGRELRQCVFRIFHAYRGVSRVRFLRFEQRWNEGPTFQRASGIRCFHDAGNSGFIEKQQRQQQSYVNTSENKVHLHEERDPSWGQNLNYNSWIPDVQKTFFWNSHLQVCLITHHDERERERHWEVILHVLRRKIPKSIGRSFHVWGLIALPLS